MKSLMSYAALSLILLISTGCLQTRSQIQDTGVKKELQQQQVSMQVQKANSEARLVDMEEQMRRLNGRIEVVEHELQQTRVARDGAMEENSRLKEDMASQLKIYHEALVNLENQVKDLTQQLADAKKNSNSAPVAKPAAPKGNYAQAEEDFDKKNWKQAIVNYQKYRDMNPKGANYAEATYKMGVSFQELKLNQEAKVFYQEVIQKFPKSRAAEKARYRMKNLK